jgi:hypothetical protein
MIGDINAIQNASLQTGRASEKEARQYDLCWEDAAQAPFQPSDWCSVDAHTQVTYPLIFAIYQQWICLG